jgi:hypothetical protein
VQAFPDLNLNIMRQVAASALLKRWLQQSGVMAFPQEARVTANRILDAIIALSIPIRKACTFLLWPMIIPIES